MLVGRAEPFGADLPGAGNRRASTTNWSDLRPPMPSARPTSSRTGHSSFRRTTVLAKLIVEGGVVHRAPTRKLEVVE